MEKPPQGQMVIRRSSGDGGHGGGSSSHAGGGGDESKASFTAHFQLLMNADSVADFIERVSLTREKTGLAMAKRQLLSDSCILEDLRSCLRPEDLFINLLVDLGSADNKTFLFKALGISDKATDRFYSGTLAQVEGVFTEKTLRLEADAEEDWDTDYETKLALGTLDLEDSNADTGDASDESNHDEAESNIPIGQTKEEDELALKKKA